MKAILLAAGVGSRISREIKIPKSMLKVDGKTIIANAVSMLRDNGIAVAVVIGYQGQKIIDSMTQYDVAYFHNPFYRITNSLASLWFARDFIDENDDIVIANADVFWTQPILDELLDVDERIVTLGDVSRIEEGDYFFQLRDNWLVNYGKDLPVSERDCEYVGIAKLRSDFIPSFKENLDELIDMERFSLWWENVLYENCAEYPVFVKDISRHFWSEVDYLEDYKRILAYHATKQEHEGGIS